MPSPGIEPGPRPFQGHALPVTPRGLNVHRGPGRDRTGDLVSARHARYRLRHKPMRRCESEARESNAVCPAPKAGGLTVSLAPDRCPAGRSPPGRAPFVAIHCGLVKSRCCRPWPEQARATGVEPATTGFGDQRSSRLSYALDAAVIRKSRPALCLGGRRVSARCALRVPPALNQLVCLGITWVAQIGGSARYGRDHATARPEPPRFDEGLPHEHLWASP